MITIIGLLIVLFAIREIVYIWQRQQDTRHYHATVAQYQDHEVRYLNQIEGLIEKLHATSEKEKIAVYTLTGKRLDHETELLKVRQKLANTMPHPSNSSNDNALYEDAAIAELERKRKEKMQALLEEQNRADLIQE
uniref:Uncharacterized protein n=1 Tax=viral metagenome TaxID=1070528 RepID=A0A6M3L626_9ZZZZ